MAREMSFEELMQQMSSGGQPEPDPHDPLGLNKLTPGSEVTDEQAHAMVAHIIYNTLGFAHRYRSLFETGGAFNRDVQAYGWELVRPLVEAIISVLRERRMPGVITDQVLFDHVRRTVSHFLADAPPPPTEPGPTEQAEPNIHDNSNHN